MTKLQDARSVLRGYYSAFNAIRADLDRIERYIGLPDTERRLRHARFADWFAHHLRMRAEHRRSEDTFFFPDAEKKAQEVFDLVTFLRQKSEKIKLLETTALQLLQDNTDEVKLLTVLTQYVAAVREYADAHETRFVPLLMQYYSREEYVRTEKAYIRTLSPWMLIDLLPWQSLRLSPEDRKAFFPELPSLLVFVLVRWWEPRYIRRYLTE